MIVAQNIVHQYPGGSSFTYPNIALHGGETLLIKGKSGSGKTTLLHLLSGLLRLQKGVIHIDDIELQTLSAKSLDLFRGKHIGLVLQQHHFVESISAADNIRLAAFLANKKIDEQHLQHLIQTLGIAKLLHKLPGTLSVGEQQRVSIARALINKPGLLLADEPTSSLDDDNCHAVASLLKALCKDAGTALIVVTHDNRLHADFPNQIVLS